MPEVVRLDFENFKNSYEEDRPIYAIEILVAPPNMEVQIRAEAERRRGLNVYAQYSWSLAQDLFDEWARMDGGWKGTASKDTNPVSKQQQLGPGTDMSSQADNKVIHRIRIQSFPVHGYLQRLLGEPRRRFCHRTFFQPFRTLIYFQPKMKEILAVLEENWSGKEQVEHDKVPEVEKSPTHTESDKTSPIFQSIENLEPKPGNVSETEEDDMVSVRSDDESTTESLNRMMDSLEALQDMRCYVDFVDKEIMPHYNFLKGSEARKVAFHDLWCLYDVGGLVYAPTTGGEDDSYQDVWRVYQVIPPRSYVSYYQARRSQEDTGEYIVDPMTYFSLDCYHIEHDGTSYGAVRQTFDIDAYPGEQNIQSLDVFPIRFLENHEHILEARKKRGLKYQNALQERHQAYNNWSLAMNLRDDIDSDSDSGSDGEQHGKRSSDPVPAEFIESQVIVDLDEAFRAHPMWRPTFHHPSIPTVSPHESQCDPDAWPKRVWNDKSRGELLYWIPEIIQHEDGIDKRRSRENMLNGDSFLHSQAEGVRWERFGHSLADLRDEDLVLLPKRLFVYTLRERKFVAIDVTYLRPITREDGVFTQLMILRDYKDIVRGLVSSHFQRKELERLYADNAIEGLSQDLIQGKGKGLVLLLHGAPGVGKTATAEAVAMENNKPLFAITCGDLGLTASEVESSLTDMFRLAHKWDCVLLLDEADVFLSQRSRFDMKRNALVSVFLRVLEYYNGLLFLTTNRVGTIDEAFKSRIHLSLYYPPLNLTQTREIFRLNINKLRDIERQKFLLTKKPALIIEDDDILNFAEEHFQNPQDSTGRWNGRQIRNAFQIASGLAYYHFATQHQANNSPQQDGDVPAAPVLGSNLFRKVQHATQNFDKYMRETRGYTDADLSFLLGERSDHMRNDRFPPASAPSTQQNVPEVFGAPPAPGPQAYPSGPPYLSGHAQGGSFPHTPVTPMNFAQHDSGTQIPSHLSHQGMQQQRGVDSRAQYMAAPFNAQSQAHQMQPNAQLNQGSSFGPAPTGRSPVYNALSPQHTSYDHTSSSYASNTQAGQSQWHGGHSQNREGWTHHSPGMPQTRPRESAEEQDLY